MNRFSTFILFSLLTLNSFAKPFEMPPTVVETVAVGTMSWQPKIQITGSTTANQGIIITPEVPGRITQIFVESGETVEKDAPLFEINPSILKAQLAEANANLELTKLNYERQTDLRKRNVASQLDFDQARALYQADAAKVEQLQAQLNQTLIRAPFAGNIGITRADIGMYANVGDSLTNLQDITPILVDFKVPEIYLKQIEPGQTIEVRTRAYPQQLFQGTIQAIDAIIDSNTRSINVRGTLPNEDKLLIPGIFVEITILTSQAQDVPVIPLTAMNYENSGQYVYKVQEGKAVKQMVQTGEQIGDYVIVLGGLAVGDEVVNAGQIKLFDGASVVVMPANEPEKNS